jgi:hypothetical protein
VVEVVDLKAFCRLLGDLPLEKHLLRYVCVQSRLIDTFELGVPDTTFKKKAWAVSPHT